MPKVSKPGDPWYDRLTEAETHEIAALDTLLSHLKAALTVASERRQIIRNRACMRKPLTTPSPARTMRATLT